MSEASAPESIATIHAPDAALDPWPIPQNQILSGDPQAFGTVLWQSADKRLLNGVWACTPGSFTWDYTWDETIYFLEGRLTITDQDGATVSLGPGDLIFVRAGTKSRWVVTEEVRKAYHIRSDTPVEL